MTDGIPISHQYHNHRTTSCMTPCHYMKSRRQLKNKNKTKKRQKTRVTEVVRCQLQLVMWKTWQRKKKENKWCFSFRRLWCHFYWIFCHSTHNLKSNLPKLEICFFSLKAESWCLSAFWFYSRGPLGTLTSCICELSKAVRYGGICSSDNLS